MVSGAILALVVTAFMRALSVINRVEHENAQYMEADAIVWDAIAETFNKDYQGIAKGKVERSSAVCGFPAQLTVSFDGTYISSWIEWNGLLVSNSVIRSQYARRRD